MNQKLKINTENFFFRLFQMVRTFIVVLIGYVFDIAPDFWSAILTFKRILLNQNWAEGIAQFRELGLDGADYSLLAVCTGILFVVSLIQERHDGITIREMLDRKPFVLRLAVIAVGIMLIALFGIYGPEFSAAEFVYMQF